MTRRPDLRAAVAHARRRLTAELSAELTYHNLAHTEDSVVPAAVRLAKHSGVGGIDLDLVITAAWFHDLGYIERYVDNEPIGARMAAEALPDFGYQPEHVDTVRGMILATTVPQRPVGTLEQVMADADLDILARPEMLAENRRLRAELGRHGRTFTDVDWYASQLRFFDAHHYFTTAARQVNDVPKSANRVVLAILHETAVQEG